MTSPQRCAVPWCRPVRPHGGKAVRVHIRDLATLDCGHVTVAVALYQREIGGVFDPPAVRVFVDSTDERRLAEQVDLTPLAATVLADALASVVLAGVGELIAAFAQAQVLLGERPEPADYYQQPFVVSALQVEADAAIHTDDPQDGDVQ